MIRLCPLDVAIAVWSEDDLDLTDVIGLERRPLIPLMDPMTDRTGVAVVCSIDVRALLTLPGT